MGKRMEEREGRGQEAKGDKKGKEKIKRQGKEREKVGETG